MILQNKNDYLKALSQSDHPDARWTFLSKYIEQFNPIEFFKRTLNSTIFPSEKTTIKRIYTNFKLNYGATNALILWAFFYTNKLDERYMEKIAAHMSRVYASKYLNPSAINVIRNLNIRFNKTEEELYSFFIDRFDFSNTKI